MEEEEKRRRGGGGGGGEEDKEKRGKPEERNSKRRRKKQTQRQKYTSGLLTCMTGCIALVVPAAQSAATSLLARRTVPITALGRCVCMPYKDSSHHSTGEVCAHAL